MSRRSICLVFVLGLVLAGASNAADPDLVGWWKLEEASGDLMDSSDKGNHGTFNGTLYQQPGVEGYALGFNGVSDRLKCGDNGRPSNTFSFGAWIKTTVPHEVDSEADQYGGVNGQHYAVESRFQGANAGAGLSVGTNGIAVYEHGDNYMPGVAVYEGEIGEDWNHIMVVYDKKQPTIYLNGKAVRTGQVSTRPEIIAPRRFGGMAYGFFEGVMDEIQVYSRALTQAEIGSLVRSFLGSETAYDPNPADEQTNVVRDTDLSWAPGDSAGTHNLYMGNSLEELESATVPTAQGLTDTSYDPGRLDFLETVFWRVDEVNATPDNTVFKGDVWSFEVEPFSIPVETITATASSASAANMGPENTIDGIGLNDLDQHSTASTDMWLSGMGDPTPSIQYAFDKPYKLHEMLVWNSNQVIEAFVGLGAKDVVIETSLDGVEWTVLEDAPQFSQATGTADYVANTIVDLGGVLAQYVRITINSGHGMLAQYGLSAVRFLYIPTFPREPQPDDGAVDVPVDVVLSWRAGREAASHELYLGTDPADLALAATTDDPSFLAEDLDYDQSYYWQVIEINEAETPSAHAGPVWSISTPAYGVVDDFDPYDDNCERIFFAWEDGLGHNGGEGIDGCDEPASNGNGGGSIVGNASAPFAERIIVNQGSTQSMPFEYDNAFGASEATLRLDGQDWTASGVQTLALAFHGTAGNTGQLYVKINNSKVAYDGDAANIGLEQWTEWSIDLSSVAGLQNVTSLTIGVDGGSASGMLYIDDIRLNP